MIIFPPTDPETGLFLSKLYPECFPQAPKEPIIEVMQKLHGYHIQNLKQNVTNLSLAIVNYAGFSFRYAYSRQNFHFDTQPALAEIYPGLTSNLKPSYSSFHSSGQSAMSSLLIAMAQVWKDFSIHSPNRPYFETPLALKLLNRGETPTGGEVLLIDSTNLHPDELDMLPALINRSLGVIVDTSLWVWNEPLFQKVINLVEGKKPFFLIRSHLKLDSLGGEYASLGSLIYFHHDSFKVSEEKFIDHLQTASSSIGSCPTLDQIFPFYKNPEFHELTFKRTTKLQESIDRLSPHLLPLVDRSRSIIEEPYHRLFLILNFRCTNKDLRKYFLKMVHMKSSPVVLADSYGFDFPSVLVSYMKEDPENIFLRICGHTLGEDRDPEIIDTLQEVIRVVNDFALPIEKTKQK